MAKQEVKTQLKKGNARFNLVGTAKVSQYTFNLDQQSSHSDWIYNTMNLGVVCKDNNTVFADMMGGYGAERDNVIYVHGVKPVVDENGEPRTDSKGNVMMQDDFSNRFTIAWEDRFDKDILETIGDLCFITVGLEQVESEEKDKEGNTVFYTVYEKFLSAYDAIEYISKHLDDGMVINVSGDLQYQTYEGNVSIKKNITSIALSKATPDKYKSTFQQTILLDKGSIGKADKETGAVPIYARVIDYMKVTKNGQVVFKGNAPFNVSFEIVPNQDKPELTKMFLEKFIKVKKGITELGVEGEIIETSTLAEISEDDIPEEIKDLIELGLYSKEEIVGKMSAGGKRVRRYVITKPLTKKVTVDGDSKLTVVRTEQRYTEEDLLVYVDEDDDSYDKEAEATESKADGNEEEDMSWLNDL